MSTNADRENDILRYLDTHPVIDKDKSVKPARRTGRAKSRAAYVRLDLHGMTQDEAAAVLRLKLRECRDDGVRRLLVIHGQGWHSKADEGPVLKNLVSAMLEHECRDLITSYRPAKPDEGGGGATMIQL